MPTKFDEHLTPAERRELESLEQQAADMRDDLRVLMAKVKRLQTLGYKRSLRTGERNARSGTQAAQADRR